MQTHHTKPNTADNYYAPLPRKPFLDGTRASKHKNTLAVGRRVHLSRVEGRYISVREMSQLLGMSKTQYRAWEARPDEDISPAKKLAVRLLVQQGTAHVRRWLAAEAPVGSGVDAHRALCHALVRSITDATGVTVEIVAMCLGLSRQGLAKMIQLKGRPNYPKRVKREYLLALYQLHLAHGAGSDADSHRRALARLSRGKGLELETLVDHATPAHP